MKHKKSDKHYQHIDVNENTKLLADSYLKHFNTFIDYPIEDKKSPLTTDIDKISVYKEKLEYRLKVNTLIFFCILVVQSIVHMYVSYLNYVFCQSKIKDLYKTPGGSNVSKEKETAVTYICGSYLVHLFLVVGYYIIGFYTVYSQKKMTIQLFETYIIIMCVSDLFFSLLNPSNFFYFFEEVMNLLYIKYIKFLHSELNRVSI